MPTTAGGLRYPNNSAAINIQGDLFNLATDVETYLSSFATTQATAAAAALATVTAQANAAAASAATATAQAAAASTDIEVSMLLGVYNG